MDAALPPPQYPPGTQFDAQGAFQMQPQEYKAWESVYAKYVPWDCSASANARNGLKCPLSGWASI